MYNINKYSVLYVQYEYIQVPIYVLRMSKYIRVLYNTTYTV